MVRFVVTFVICILVSIYVANAQSAVSDADMILSKSDAKMMFTLSRTDWNNNVAQAVSAGVAQANGVPDRGYGMVTAHEYGFMIVSPDYSKEPAPDFIQVIVAYRNPFAQEMPSSVLQEMIEQAKKELSPDFSVIGNVENHDGGKAVFFIISPG